MPDYRTKFSVASGTKIHLEDFDPSGHGKVESEEDAKLQTTANLEELKDLQSLLYAEGKHSLLIVFQGLDTSGKDGAIKHVFSGVNPQGCQVVAFKEPTPTELAHDFLWRVHPHVPPKGSIAIFNRSHYEAVLVERVYKLVPRSKWSQRYDLIKDFERTVHSENDTTILKFFLHISKEEQLNRFKDRLVDPKKRWRISEADYKDRGLWDEYTEAYEELLRKTSTKHAPWFIIPSDKKWFRNLAISQILVNTLSDLKMKPPEPKVDLAEIEKQFHLAERESKTKQKKC